jgi:hypothetical protein
MRFLQEHLPIWNYWIQYPLRKNVDRGSDALTLKSRNNAHILAVCCNPIVREVRGPDYFLAPTHLNIEFDEGSLALDFGFNAVTEREAGRRDLVERRMGVSLNDCGAVDVRHFFFPPLPFFGGRPGARGIFANASTSERSKRNWFPTRVELNRPTRINA